jgi:DNA-directed RNA polymerase specialized sigma24 family protein
MTKSLITEIKSATTREELREALATRKPELRHVFLKNAIDSLNKEVECDIMEGNTDVAIFKMSQVVMLEDEKHIVERVLLAQGILVR